MTRVLLLVLVLCIAQPLIAAGQTLADVARQEEARRKAVKEHGKVYTNKDLRADISRPPPPDAGAPAAAGATGSTDARPATDAKPAAGDKPAEKATPDQPEKDQAYWSGRIGAARAALERSRIFADALQSRLNALATDFVNRDDPAQRAQIELERQRATTELARVTKEIADQTRTIADIEEEARRAGVPPGWLR